MPIKRTLYIANLRLPTEKAYGIQIAKMCEAFADYGLPRIGKGITTDSHGLISGNQDVSGSISGDHNLLYEDLTYKIRGCIFNVYNTLGFGHKGSVYQKSLEQEFQKEELKFESQKHLAVRYGGQKVGDYIPDFVVEDKVIVELKSSKFLT
ncbi:MAG: GxxExxY protein, partial [Candidatus Taylorbacteria bacterium]|nr:GxxExxY protein [Candidatus Taylorbacteria bacterium]